NDSPAGPILNATTGNRFSYLWAESFTVLFDAIANRASSANDLVGAYDNVLRNMRRNLKAFDELRDWAKFYAYQERMRLRGSVGDAIADSALDQAQKQTQEASSLSEAGGNILPESPYTSRIDQIVDAAGIETESVKAQVTQLLQSAKEKDEAAARQQE